MLALFAAPTAVTALDFSEDGSGLIAVGFRSGTVRVDHVEDGAPYRTFVASTSNLIRVVKFIPTDPARLDLSTTPATCRPPAAGMSTQSPRTESPRDETPGAQVPAPLCGLAVGCGPDVHLFDVHGDVLLRKITGESQNIQSIALDRASPFLVTTCGDRTAQVYSREFELHQTLRGHTDTIMGAAVATLSHTLKADGTTETSAVLVATASSDRTVRLWFVDRAHGQAGHPPPPSCALEGHTDGVRTVDFVRPSPRRVFVASGSNDHEIRLWDAATRHCVAVLAGHTGLISTVLCCQHSSGRLVSISMTGDRMGQWELSDFNDRPWCGASFAHFDTADTTVDRQTFETDSTDASRTALANDTALKYRAIRERTDVMAALPVELPQRGLAAAATERDGRVLVAIGTNTGFDISVQDVVPSSVSSAPRDNRDSGPADLVVGSDPSVVALSDFRDATQETPATIHHGVPGDHDRIGSVCVPDDQIGLVASGADSENENDRAPTWCSRLRRVSTAVRTLMIAVVVLGLLSPLLWGGLTGAFILNPQPYLYAAFIYTMSVFVAFALVVHEEMFSDDEDGNDRGFCSFLFEIFAPTVPLLTGTLWQLFSSHSPRGFVERRRADATTSGALRFARVLEDRWWRWGATAAFARPFGRIAMLTSCALLPVHVACVRELSHLSVAVYEINCSVRIGAAQAECLENSMLQERGSLIFAAVMFILYYSLAAALGLIAVVPVPRAALFVVSTMVLDYATWVELAVSPNNVMACFAWFVVVVMVFIATITFVFAIMGGYCRLFDRDRPVLGVCLAVFGVIVFLLAVPASVGLGLCFCAALTCPVLILSGREGPLQDASVITMWFRALCHKFCEDGMPQSSSGAVGDQLVIVFT